MSDFICDPAEAAVEAEIERQMARMPLCKRGFRHFDPETDRCRVDILNTEGYSDEEVYNFVEWRVAPGAGAVSINRCYFADGVEHAFVEFYA